MYKSIADGFKVINATEGFKGFTLVSSNDLVLASGRHCEVRVYTPQSGPHSSDVDPLLA